MRHIKFITFLLKILAFFREGSFKLRFLNIYRVCVNLIFVVANIVISRTPISSLSLFQLRNIMILSKKENFPALKKT